MLNLDPFTNLTHFSDHKENAQMSLNETSYYTQIWSNCQIPEKEKLSQPEFPVIHKSDPIVITNSYSTIHLNPIVGFRILKIHSAPLTHFQISLNCQLSKKKNAD